MFVFKLCFLPRFSGPKSTFDFISCWAGWATSLNMMLGGRFIAGTALAGKIGFRFCSTWSGRCFC